MALSWSHEPIPEVHGPMPPLCSRCQVTMIPVEGYPGLWRCPANPEHTYDEETHEAAGEPPGDGEQSRRPDGLEPVGPNPLIDRAAPYWLSHLGLRAPLPPVPQASNMGDGSGCLPLGEIKRGGGSKSGRRRKKPRKVRRELWEG